MRGGGVLALGVRMNRALTTLRIFYAYLRDALCTGPVSGEAA